MRCLLIATATICATLAVPAFAQANPRTAQPALGQTKQDYSYTDTAGQWVPPYGQPVSQKTRAQVYRELVQAEQDGQLAYLDSTIYAH
ncbi:DUF4148 domain-containing protein (plasmid) [Burkholderia pyrrocinia]|uniref:DUF4148 domain-containing protein n=1 Tax=Burkholderia pyrrocinia TaxID=60550 RepID=UPI0038B4F668